MSRCCFLPVTVCSPTHTHTHTHTHTVQQLVEIPAEVPLSHTGFVIGRQGADLSLTSGYVSRKHAQLQRTATGWRVLDTSTNGLCVNNVYKHTHTHTHTHTHAFVRVRMRACMHACVCAYFYGWALAPMSWERQVFLVCDDAGIWNASILKCFPFLKT
jgi:hypothetical protein